MGTEMVFEFRLSETDRAKYDRGEEWFTYDPEDLLTLTSGQLERYEDAMNYTIVEMTRDFWRRSAKALRGAMWVTRRRAGVQEQWASFDPQILQAEWRIVGEEGDADNPPDVSPEPKESPYI